MKYIKIFENFQNIVDDIFSISYIITDLGYEFNLQYHREGMSYSWVDCKPGDRDPKNENQYRIEIISKSFTFEAIENMKSLESNSEFSEFMDRLREICSNNFHVELLPLPYSWPNMMDVLYVEARGVAVSIRIFNKKHD